MTENYTIPIKCYTCNKIISTSDNYNLIEKAIVDKDITTYVKNTSNNFCCNVYFMDIFYKSQKHE